MIMIMIMIILTWDESVDYLRMNAFVKNYQERYTPVGTCRKRQALCPNMVHLKNSQ